MAKALGIGVRVYVGWAPASMVHGDATDATCRTGTIDGGPIEPCTARFFMDEQHEL